MAQAAAMGVSIYALVDSQSNPKPVLLIVILILELIVQGVELTWYGVVGLMYYCGGSSIGVQYRYIDWAVSTPTMLISILLFIWYLQCDLTTLEDIGSDGSKIAGILTSVILNWVMLLMGYFYEAKVESVTSVLDSLLGRDSGLYLAFLPFLGSFAPIFVAVVAKPTPLSYFVSILTFVIWGIYGIVAIAYRTPEGDAAKNTFYNLLDIVSKNITGVTIGIISVLYTSVPIADLELPLCNYTFS